MPDSGNEQTFLERFVDGSVVNRLSRSVVVDQLLLFLCIVRAVLKQTRSKLFELQRGPGAIYTK